MSMEVLWLTISFGSMAVVWGPEISRKARRFKDLVKKGTETSEAMAEQRRLGYILEARREMMEAFKKEIQTEALKPWTRSSTGEKF
jgi:hypothetical protein